MVLFDEKMPTAIWGIKHKDAHAPFVYEHPAENEKIQLLKNTSCCIPIDADFKNVYFHIFILSRSRVISQKPPFLSPVASNVQKRWFFVYNLWITQVKRIKVYIFEISVKFRVDWYATWRVFKKLNFSTLMVGMLTRLQEKMFNRTFLIFINFSST